MRKRIIGRDSARSGEKHHHGSSPSDQLQDSSDRGERHAVSFRGIVTLKDGSTFPVRLVDLSYDGCRIEASNVFNVGDPVSLSVRGGVIDSMVRWASDGEAGLLFTSSPRPSPEPPPIQVARDGKRVPTRITATMRRLGRSKFVVPVGDLSTHGCKVEFVDRPEVDEQVRMRFSGLEPVEGHIRWVAGTEAGVRFDRPFHPAVLELLIQRLTTSN
jgi:hypothetical protein